MPCRIIEARRSRHAKFLPARGRPPDGVKTLVADTFPKITFIIMKLVIILTVLMVVLGGAGIYFGGPMLGIGGFDLFLLVLLVLFFTGVLRDPTVS